MRQLQVSQTHAVVFKEVGGGGREGNAALLTTGLEGYTGQ